MDLQRLEQIASAMNEQIVAGPSRWRFKPLPAELRNFEIRFKTREILKLCTAVSA